MDMMVGIQVGRHNSGSDQLIKLMIQLHFNLRLSPGVALSREAAVPSRKGWNALRGSDGGSAGQIEMQAHA